MRLFENQCEIILCCVLTALMREREREREREGEREKIIFWNKFY